MATTIQAAPLEPVATPEMPKADPCTVVIFGANGDLTRRMLMPALFDLACIGCMSSQQFQILGSGRSPMTDDQFREQMRSAVEKSSDTVDFNDAKWRSFARRLYYIAGDLADVAFYEQLKARLESMRKEVPEESAWASKKQPAQTGANQLFYLSTPPSLAPAILKGLGAAGLAENSGGWARVIVEKPFGRDLDSARELNRVVAAVFPERNVFRIDHYLGKETVQNILVFRFGNTLFEPVWNRNYISHVEITAAETLGVEGRAGFYEETGALRDMVANHMLQLVSLTAMEPPVNFDADSVRESKVQVLRSIHPMNPEQVAKCTVRGQYGAGAVHGEKVPGYRAEPGVNKDSNTETYAAVEFRVENWRWAGVPFYVRTGKRLARQNTEVVVHFRRTPQALFARTPDEKVQPNDIIIGIQPNEGIAITLGAKRPGAQTQMIGVQADFSYEKAFGVKNPPAYETLLLDAMRGDATLFTRADEVEAEWQIITPIEEAWAQAPPPQFPNYSAGSEGPEAADRLMAQECRHWRAIGDGNAAWSAGKVS